MTKKTALHDWHIKQGAKMVDFARYSMPVQYPEGIMKEHLHTRAQAGLFDVSHMGQILITGQQVAQSLERLLPADLLELEQGQQRYSVLTNAQGTIDDDLMLTKRAQDFYVVVNAACKESDFEKLVQGLPDCQVSWWQDRALLALQGPLAVEVLSKLAPEVAELAFMRGAEVTLLGEKCWVSRSGYTGEDGFEISLPNHIAEAFADRLLEDARVKPIGLGARDSLRLEAGLCLYGNDIDTTTTPIEAGLLWSIQKTRRPQGERAGGYVGAEVIGAQIESGALRKRVGLEVAGRLPVRAHTPIFVEDKQVGEVSSGGFAPSVDAPVAMGYVDSEFAAVGTALKAKVRDKWIDLTVVRLPFIKKSYQK